MANQQREIYRGRAVIMNVTLEGVADWKEWERKSLSESDLVNAFKIVYDVAECDANGERHDVKVEISHRELRGKMLEYFKREDGRIPTQIDVAVRSLKQQGIVGRAVQDESGLGPAVDDSLCGREVTIRAYEELGADGVKWWPRCVFASKAKRVSGADKSAFLAAFQSGKPSPSAVCDEPATCGSAIHAPSDDDDLPF